MAALEEMSRVLAALVLLVPGSAGIASPPEQEDPVMKALDAEVALDHDWIASQPQADTALRASATSLKMVACTPAGPEFWIGRRVNPM